MSYKISDLFKSKSEHCITWATWANTSKICVESHVRTHNFALAHILHQ